MRIALVVPHIFFNQEILPNVIFSPGELAISLAKNLAKLGHEITVFSPGLVEKYLVEDGDSTKIKNHTADLSLFEKELAFRGDSYLDLLKKHPLTFITLSRQVQSELISRAFSMANQNKFDVVHIWCNEEEQALVMSDFCKKPVIFNHHEPFNFLTRYRAIFPKYPHLNWISFSMAQRKTFQAEKKINWVGNVYHGLEPALYQLSNEKREHLLYFGRIIQPKGVHYAISVAKKMGIKLKIAGKHYAGHSKDKYWQEFIQPEIDGQQIEYVGFIKDQHEKQRIMSKAKALLMPSTWQEPFGLVMIEALACGTPVIGFNQGAVPEVIKNGLSGYVVEYQAETNEEQKQTWTQIKKNKNYLQNVDLLAKAVDKIKEIQPKNCRAEFEKKFTAQKMAKSYESIYQEQLR